MTGIYVFRSDKFGSHSIYTGLNWRCEESNLEALSHEGLARYFARVRNDGHSEQRGSYKKGAH